MKTIDINEKNSFIDYEISIDFPIEIFPDEIQDLISNAKETVKFNPDYFSAGILSNCATAIGNSINLNNGSYTVKPILWLVAVGLRGTGKTAPLEYAKKPLSNNDNDSFELYKKAMKEYDQQPKDFRGKQPIYSKFILEDFTPEKLGEMLQINKKGLLIFNDELIGWVNSFDQYKKGGDQQLYLNLWNGGSLSVDRVTKEPLRVEKTNVNVLGGMQPEKLKEFAKNGRKYDGFLDRFLFIIPKHLNPYQFTGLDIKEKNKKYYDSFIKSLLNAPERSLQINSKVIKIYKDWQYPKAKECFHDPIEIAIQAKLETYAWRFLLIIDMMRQVASNKLNSNVDPESMRKAIKLAEYFRNNALIVHDKYLTTNPITELTTVQKEIFAELPNDFKRSEVIDLLHNKGLKGGTADRFLKNRKLFEAYTYGHYNKLVIKESW